MKFAKHLCQKNRNFVWHIDATGSVVRPTDERPVYYYAVVTPMSEKGMPAFPLYEFLSNVHNTGTLKLAFVACWGHMDSLG